MITFTHDFADTLKRFAMALKRGPNVDISQLGEMLNYPDMLSSSTSKPQKRQGKEDLPLALSALLSLSRVDKKEWVELIYDLGLDIVVRPRDASRDILGKVLKVLEEEPQARERLQRRVKSRGTQGSPELARALSSLLGS